MQFLSRKDCLTRILNNSLAMRQKERNAVWELAHKTAFLFFWAYGALPQRGNGAKQRFRAEWLNCYC